MAFEFVEDCKGGFEAVERLARADPAEIACRHDGQKIKPDICRRGAMRHDGRGVFLEIVGRQEIVIRRHEGLEEAPGAPRREPQGPRVVARNAQMPQRARRTAGKSRDKGREDPKHGERRGNRPGAVPGIYNKCAGERREGEAGGDLRNQAAPVEPVLAARLRRRHPFEQASAANEEPKNRTCDGIDHDPGLMRQKGQQKGALHHAELDIARHAAPVIAQGDADTARHQHRKRRQQCRQSNKQENERRPIRRLAKRQEPAEQQGEQRRRRRQRAAQIVEQLPAPGERYRGAAARRFGPASEDPWQQLPVAAHPAMLARRGDVVARGKFLDHLDVGGQTGAGENAFKQIVAENRVDRNAPIERRVEGIDVVDAFADIGALVVKVLIDVGDDDGIGIEPRGSGEHALEQRAFVAGRQ